MADLRSIVELISCCGRADCADTNCPGRPLPSAADMAAGLRALHTEDGGSWLTDGFLRLRPADTCSVCGGSCLCPQACGMPVATPAPKPASSDWRARVRLFINDMT